MSEPVFAQEFEPDDPAERLEARASLYEFCLDVVADLPDGQVIRPEWMVGQIADRIGLAADHPMRHPPAEKRPATVGELRAMWRRALVEMGRLSDESLTVFDGKRRLL